MKSKPNWAEIVWILLTCGLAVYLVHVLIA